MSTDSVIDPRIQENLELLNSATEAINSREIELGAAKKEFEALLKESVERIKQSASKVGHSIETAKPYYEARLYCNQLSKETLEAQANYDKAKSTLAAAKEMVSIAEQGLGEKSNLDQACQEMLSHAIQRVNECQQSATEARNLLKMCELKQEVSNNRVTKLQSSLKAAIRSSSLDVRRRLLLINLVAYQHELLFLPYYETKANCNGLLKAQKMKIAEIEARISEAKMTYNEALKNLEGISEEIHRIRQETKTKMEKLTAVRREERVPTPARIEPSVINCPDEYLDLPKKLTLKSSPVKQFRLEKHSCPHLLKDFDIAPSSSRLRHSNSNDDSDVSPSQTDITNLSSDEIEQWTEIRLSSSESSSSACSGQQSTLDDVTPSDSSSGSENLKKVIVTKVFKPQSDEDTGGQETKRSGSEGLSTWLSRSSFRNEGRRQSFDLLIDNTKEIFQGITKSLERRNSESEVNQAGTDFFSFGKSTLTDEQIENLRLDDEGFHISEK